MPVIDINGVSVKFPFEPYPVQRDYMEKVIETLDKGHNAFLESPTGTGKTLCLLCATLGWVEKEKKKGNVKNQFSRNDGMDDKNGASFNDDIFRLSHISPFFPPVIYSSRTHSQLSQAMKELKNTEYSYMKTGLVASRDQLCINGKLQCESNANKTYICQSLIKDRKNNKGCVYHENVNHGIDHMKKSGCTIPDIEELVRVGHSKRACPYYMAKTLAERADIVFMPYNYLLDPKIRYANNIDLKNAIVILDESHNVENMCEESASTEITSTKVGIAIRDIRHIIDNGMEIEEMLPKDLAALASLIQKLEIEIFNIEMKNGGVGGDSHDGDFIFQLLEKAGITESNHGIILKYLHNLIGALVNASRNAVVTENGVVLQKCPEGIGLRSLLSFLRVAFSSSAPHLRDRVIRSYKIYIEREADKNTTLDGATIVEKSHPRAKIINVWCFSPAFGMQFLMKQNPRSVIFTSGTLTPLKPLITEMDVPNSIELVNPHILRPFQVSVKIVESGPDRRMLKSNYNNRENEDYLRSLGKTILEFSKVVPDGLLVFFPSYSVMNICMNFWRNNDIWSLINEQKQIFEEPRQGPKEVFLATMKGYYAAINEPNSSGAIFMAVMRGKVSEGLDFADMYGRGVIITGIPFAPYKDPKIILKKKYLDESRRLDKEMISGQEWYRMTASRAINQAIGRVIRHINDYGAILFCDNRFHEPSNQKNISGWVSSHVKKKYQPFDEMIRDLQQFYENAKNQLPEPKPKIPEIAEFEGDTSDLVGLNGEISGLDVKYDDGPIPETPFKSFGESSRNINQSVVERKRRKIDLIDNDNDNENVTIKTENI